MAEKQPGKDAAAQAGGKTTTVQPSTSGATGCTGAFTPRTTGGGSHKYHHATTNIGDSQECG